MTGEELHGLHHELDRMMLGRPSPRYSPWEMLTPMEREVYNAVAEQRDPSSYLDPEPA